MKQTPTHPSLEGEHPKERTPVLRPEPGGDLKEGMVGGRHEQSQFSVARRLYF